MLNEDHPLALNLSFSVSLGLMPVTLSVKTTGCGIRKSEFTADEAGEMEIDSKGFSYPTNKASLLFLLISKAFCTILLGIVLLSSIFHQSLQIP